MNFRINVSKVRNQAEMIGNDATDLNNLIRELGNLKEDGMNAWQGDAADAFFSKMSILINDMNRTRRQMSTLSETIMNCADRIQKEDEEQERAAQMLNGSGNGGGNGESW